MQALFIIATILLVFYCSLIIYYRFAFKAIPSYKAPKKSTEELTYQPINQTTISIIIPARNEAHNIAYCLQSILQNNYATNLYEIIVVDDHSTDDTAKIIQGFSAQNVKLISLKDFVSKPLNSYKKKAIEIGITQAIGTLVITTDADCEVSQNWLQTIVNFYETKKPVFIAAPVLISPSNFGEGFGVRSKWSFIQIFQSLDFMTLQGITAAVVHRQQMCMCNGANMAYEKKVFEEVGGFTGIDKIASGDDMLLMHKMYDRYPQKVLFLKSQQAIVKTAAVQTIQQFFNQRIRWASKADKYDDKRILPVLVLVYFFNLMMLLLPIISIFYNPSYAIYNSSFTLLQCWALMLFVKTLVELFFLYPVAIFFNKKSLLWLFPIMQPFHILYTVIAGWLGKFGKYTWKERIVN